MDQYETKSIRCTQSEIHGGKKLSVKEQCGERNHELPNIVTEAARSIRQAHRAIEAVKRFALPA